MLSAFRVVTFPKKAIATLGLAMALALILQASAGLYSARAQGTVDTFRVTIEYGVFVVGHTLPCFVQQGVARFDAGASNWFWAESAGPTTGRFDAVLRKAATDPQGEGPCGTVQGTVTFEINPQHGAGFYGNWNGQVTSHSGPQPFGNFTGALVNGNYQISKLAADRVGIGEGSMQGYVP